MRLPTPQGTPRPSVAAVCLPAPGGRGPIASRLVFRLVRFLAVLAAASIGVTGVVVAAAPQVNRILNAHEEVPLTLPEIVAQPSRSFVYDSTGLNVTDIFKVENREPFKLDRVPEPVTAAILAVEDADFWKHDGVSGRSILRALMANVGSGSVEQGGSTITQQVVKNLIMSPTTERTIQTKVIEAVVARRLEKKMGKPYVLEQYLNAVYFGNNAYGLQSAAEVYFGKNVEQLTMVEGAFLGGMIRNPTDYDPFVRPERARYRLRQALDRLVAVERLDAAEAELQASGFVLPQAPQRLPQLAVARSYFTEEVKDYLLNDSTILGATYQERYNKLFRGGLRIYTTEDLYLEAFARDARNQVMPQTSIGIDAAVVSLNTKTGGVVAMRGGPDFAQSQVNLTKRGRQTGSAFKFVILTAALAAGAEPQDVINGQAPCSLPNPGDPEHPFEIGSNDERVASRGVAQLTVQTWSSINCAFGRLAQAVGLNRVVDFAHKLGIKGTLNNYPSLATGNNEVSPLDMASAFQTVANQGVHLEPYYVEKILAADGSVIYQHQPQPVQVISPDVANNAIDIMRGVLDEGHRPQGTPERGPSRRREDRYPGLQHERLVRRCHAAVHHRGVGGRPQGPDPHAGDPGVLRQWRQPRARRRLSGGDLEVLHGRHACVRPPRGLAGPRADPWAAPHLHPGGGVRLPGARGARGGGSGGARRPRCAARPGRVVQHRPEGDGQRRSHPTSWTWPGR